MPRHSRVVGGTAADRWRNRVTAHDSNVVVALSNADLCDVDLEPLMAYLDSLLRDEIWPAYWMYSLDLDLSCNCGITDFGVCAHHAIVRQVASMSSTEALPDFHR